MPSVLSHELTREMAAPITQPAPSTTMVAPRFRYAPLPDRNPETGALARTCAEFFAGIGLMRMGLERAGWTTLFANDIDPAKHSMYYGHFRDHDARFVLGDIHGLPAAAVPTVTLATASFPCTDLSLAGDREGLGGQDSSAFWGFVDVVRRMGKRQPPIVLIENVPGFLTSDGGQDFRRAMLALNELGYLVDPFIIDAAHFVPQSRERLFVVGTLRSVTVCEAALSLTPPEPDTLRSPKLLRFISQNADIAWSLARLPALPLRATCLTDVLEDLPDDAPEWWSPDRADYLLGQMSSRHRQMADAMIAGPVVSYGTLFRRVRKKRSMAELRADGLAGCLRTPKGGSGRQILLKAGCGRYQARLITPRECARLMGAGEYRISANLNQALFGFGDAVCVPVVEWIAKHYLNRIGTGAVLEPDPQQAAYAVARV